MTLCDKERKRVKQTHKEFPYIDTPLQKENDLHVHIECI